MQRNVLMKNRLCVKQSNYNSTTKDRVHRKAILKKLQRVQMCGKNGRKLDDSITRNMEKIVSEKLQNIKI